MRNYYFIAAMVGLLLMGCSVDNDETSFNNDQIKTANSVWEVDGCESISFEFHSSLGEFVITNDIDNLYLNFFAKDGFLIYDIRWEVMPSEADLPINANGINPTRLDERDKFDSGTSYHGETVALSDFGDDLGYVIIAAEVTFKNSLGQKFVAWVGSESDFRNGSNYLVYDICDPLGDPVCSVSAGADQFETISDLERRKLIVTAEEIEAYYLSMLDESATSGGEIFPTGAMIRKDYLLRTEKFGLYEVTYTVIGEGGCVDEAKLTLELIP